MISENIPVSQGLGTNFNAIILQSNGVAAPVLSLGIGKVQPFQYGLQPYSIGAYGSTSSEFHVSFFTPKANLGSTLNQTVRLFATSVDVEIVAVDELNNKSAICSFGQKL